MQTSSLALVLAAALLLPACGSDTNQLTPLPTEAGVDAGPDSAADAAADAAHDAGEISDAKAD